MVRIRPFATKYTFLPPLFNFFFPPLGNFSAIVKILNDQFADVESNLPLHELSNLISPSETKEHSGKDVMELRDPVRDFHWFSLVFQHPILGCEQLLLVKLGISCSKWSWCEFFYSLCNLLYVFIVNILGNFNIKINTCRCLVLLKTLLVT